MDEWFTTFFDRLANDFWDAAIPEEATAGEVDARLGDMRDLNVGSVDESSFGPGAGRLLVVARRRG